MPPPASTDSPAALSSPARTRRLRTLSAWKVGDDSGWRAGFVIQGAFELEGLTPGRWRVSVHEHGLSGPARHGDAEVELRPGVDGVVTIELAPR